MAPPLYPAEVLHFTSHSEVSHLSISRYKSLCSETWPTWEGRPHDGVAVLVKHLGYKQEEYKMGRSVISFFPDLGL